jgi:hypothetical protein
MFHGSVSAEGEGGRAQEANPLTGKVVRRTAALWWDASPDGWHPDGNYSRLKYDCKGHHRTTVGYVTMDRLTAKYHQAVERGDTEILLYS